MKKPKILIADDEILLLKSTTIALELFNFEVQTAMSGEECLNRVNELLPDLILLDIMMPGMDGWEVLQKLRENDKTRHIPVIVFTAKEYSNGKGRAKAQGASNFVAKPFEIEELVAVIQRHLYPREGGQDG